MFRPQTDVVEGISEKVNRPPCLVAALVVTGCMALVFLVPAVSWALGSLTISLEDVRSRPVEGTASATPAAGGASRSCTTRAGRCSVTNLAAGRYRVSATTLRGTASSVTATVQDGAAVWVRVTITDAAPVAAPLAVTGVLTGANTPAPRNLGSGRRSVIRGSTQDQRGRAVEGTVTVKQRDTVVGTVATVGGSFQVFDLSRGPYDLSFTALTGQRTSRQVTIEAGPAISVRLIVQR